MKNNMYLLYFRSYYSVHTICRTNTTCSTQKDQAPLQACWLLFHSSWQIQLSRHLDILCPQSCPDKQGSTVVSSISCQWAERHILVWNQLALRNSLILHPIILMDLVSNTNRTWCHLIAWAAYSLEQAGFVQQDCDPHHSSAQAGDISHV